MFLDEAMGTVFQVAIFAIITFEQIGAIWLKPQAYVHDSIPKESLTALAVELQWLYDIKVNMHKGTDRNRRLTSHPHCYTIVLRGAHPVRYIQCPNISSKRFDLKPEAL